MVDFPEIDCKRCNEKECNEELEERNGLFYRKCEVVGLKPVVMSRNYIVWNLFATITRSKLFKHYPFLLRDMIKDLSLRLSADDIMRLSKLYNMYIREEIKKCSNIPWALVSIL